MRDSRGAMAERISRETFTLGEARRIALAAQGFDRPRPCGRVDARHLRRTLRQLGLLQVDYTNVVSPAHYLVLFSRLGPYARSRLDDLVYVQREFVEQWAHEASILPAETWPLLRHRMREHSADGRLAKLMQRYPQYFDWVLEQVRERGPLAPEDLPGPKGTHAAARSRRGWTVAREALEWHFSRGNLAISERRDSARVFDLTERVLTPECSGRAVGAREAQRRLLLLAARAQGVADAKDLADYYRVPVGAARPLLATLVATGELREVRIEGWQEPAFLHPQATLPRRIGASALLSPFDPVVWYPERARRLFGFEHRVEILVPLAERRWGYYVLPFLLGDRLVARVDLEADRSERRLRVLAAHLEPEAEPEPVASALATELQSLGSWLDLDSVAVGRRGDLVASLAAALRT